MKKIGVILNPNAKKFRTGKDSINDYLKYKSDNVIISTPQNVEDVLPVIKSYQSQNIDYICIGGGDGTIHLVLSEILKVCKPDEIPPILILKDGTMNNISRSIKLKGVGPAILKRLITKISENSLIETEDRFTLKIKDKYCFLFGTGLVTNFLDKVYSGTEKGFFRNVQVGMMAIKDIFMDENNCEIVKLTEQAIFIDDKKVLINPVSGILAGTVEHIGMSFYPLKDAVHNTGKFQVIVLGLSAGKILLNLNKIRTGKRIKSPKYFNAPGESILIKQKGMFSYTMDGEIYNAENELRVSAGPIIKLVKV